MLVYFVRHGETEADSDQIHRYPDTALSERGRHQARFLAERLHGITFQQILASDYQRAAETAEIIADSLQQPVEFTFLLRERKRPSELLGLRYDSPEAMAIKNQIARHYFDADWHYSDEENFFELKDRLQQFIEQLEQYHVERMLVVTHDVVIRLLISLMIFETKLTPGMYLKLSSFFRMSNTGLSVCRQREQGWRLLTWNDISHLGVVPESG